MFRDKIKELLGLHIPANIVASAVGVSESYVSQLYSEEEFRKEVQELKLQNTLESAERDKKYNRIEDKLLGLLEEKLESGLLFTKPHEILSAIRIINAAVRRAAPAELQPHIQQQVVNLHLPEGTFAARFVVSKDNQVVEIAGQSIATASAKNVNEMLEERRKNAEKNTELDAQDRKTAEEKVRKLVRLEHLPVVEVL